MDCLVKRMIEKGALEWGGGGGVDWGDWKKGGGVELKRGGAEPLV